MNISIKYGWRERERERFEKIYSFKYILSGVAGIVKKILAGFNLI